MNYYDILYFKTSKYNKIKIILDLDVVKIPSNSQFDTTSDSLSYILNSPSGSFEDIFIKCIDIINNIKNVTSICKPFSTKFNCTCQNLYGATEYKIQFLTTKLGWNDSIFEFDSNIYTSNKELFNIIMHDFIFTLGII